ncbi:MAG: PIN domain-containing protein [Acidobacteria bacterium]|nr:MAG: PIN domain-containing protein [Acidobacteriota bacterium]
MTLVDTSVWVRALMGKLEYQAKLDGLLARRIAGGHELVHGELLAGDTGGRARLLRDYRELPWAPRLPHEQVAAWARRHQLCGRGVGWIDLHLLAAAQQQNWPLWTADERLADLAQELRLAYAPGNT